MRFFYIKRTGRAKHGEVPYAICAYCMEKLSEYVPGNKVEVVVVPDSCKIDY
jgi:hypothetical protein